MKKQSWSRFSEAILPLHDCRSLDDLGPALLRSMQALLDADIHAVNWLGAVKVQDISSHSGDLPMANALEILNAHFEDHPLLPMVDATRLDGQSRAGRWSDFTTLREFRDTGLYHDFFRPMRSTRQIAMTLRISGRVSVGLSFNRQGSDYTSADLQALRALAPHISHATQTMLGRAEIERAMMLRELAVGEEAVIVASDAGRVLFATEKARRLIQDYFDLPLDAGLPMPLLTKLCHISGMEEHIIARQADRALICVGSPPAAWPSYIDPGLIGSDLAFLHARCLRLSERIESSSLEMWRSLGFTPRESEVLHWIIQGKRDAEIGEILTTSVRTVQKQVQNILSKLGVETRTAAATEALRRITLRSTPTT